MASWVDIPDYVKKLIWGKINANQLKNDVVFNNEVISQWLDVDTTVDGAAAGQGLAKQLRNANGTGNSFDPTNLYQGHIVMLNIDAFSTVGDIASHSVKLEAVDDSDHGIDWRNRKIFIIGEQGGTNSLPTDTNETDHFTMTLSVAAPPVTAQINSGVQDGSAGSLFLGYGYTGSGLAKDAALGAGAIVLQYGNLDIWLHAISATSSPFTAGDLAYTYLDDGAVRTALEMFLILFVSPPFA